MNNKMKTRTKMKRPYQKPEITTYSEEEILELIGPAHTVGSDFPGKGWHYGWERGRGNPHR